MLENRADIRLLLLFKMNDANIYRMHRGWFWC
jgi:hypothetical protein